MAVTRQDVRCLDLNNEFIQVPDSVIDILLPIAATCVNATTWGPLAEHVEALHVLHMLSDLSRGSAGVAGPITAEAAGGLSRSFAAQGGDFLTSGLATSGFGRQILTLAKKLALNKSTILYTDLGV